MKLFKQLPPYENADIDAQVKQIAELVQLRNNTFDKRERADAQRAIDTAYEVLHFMQDAVMVYLDGKSNGHTNPLRTNKPDN